MATVEERDVGTALNDWVLIISAGWGKWKVEDHPSLLVFDFSSCLCVGALADPAGV